MLLEQNAGDVGAETGRRLPHFGIYSGAQCRRPGQDRSHSMSRGTIAGGAGRVPRHLRADTVRRRRRGAVHRQQAGAGQLPGDQSRLGPRRRHGVLRLDGGVRRASEPGGHAGGGRAPRVPVAEGDAVRGGADRRRVRGGLGRLPDLSRGPRRVRWRRAAGAGTARHRRHLRDLPAAVPEHVSGRVHRPGGRHRDSRRGDSRDHGHTQRPSAGRARRR